MIDAMHHAEEVEDGLCFDEDEIAVVLENLKQAHDKETIINLFLQ